MPKGKDVEHTKSQVLLQPRRYNERQPHAQTLLPASLQLMIMSWSSASSSSSSASHTVRIRQPYSELNESNQQLSLSSESSPSQSGQDLPSCGWTSQPGCIMSTDRSLVHRSSLFQSTHWCVVAFATGMRFVGLHSKVMSPMSP